MSRQKGGSYSIARDQRVYSIRVRIGGHIQKLHLRLQDIAVFYEVFKSEVYKQELNRKNPVILDIGAHIGLASVYFYACYGLATKLYSIEPADDNIILLKKNLSAYPAQIKEVAIADYTGHVRISSSGYGHNRRIVKEGTETTVPCITISQLISEEKIKKIDLLKIDIEGAESLVFSGNLSWLDPCDRLIVETHTERIKENLLGKLKSRSFSCISKGSILYCHRKLI